MSIFKEIKVKDFTPDPFGLKNKWMLVSAAKADGTINTMTASWGGFGIMWNKEVAFVVIRPQRYTKEFVDEAQSFSLTFFDKSYLKDLSYLGKVSGKEEDKISKVGFTIIKDNDIPYFEQAHTVMFATKLFAQPIKEDAFIEKDIINQWYPSKDFHILYIAEIDKILTKEE